MVAQNDSSPTLSSELPGSGGGRHGGMTPAEAAEYLGTLGHEAAGIARAYGLELTATLFGAAATATRWER